MPCSNANKSEIGNLIIRCSKYHRLPSRIKDSVSLSFSFSFSFLLLLPSSRLPFLGSRESREKREEEASGAAALRWLEGGDVGVHACSRARHTRGRAVAGGESEGVGRNGAVKSLSSAAKRGGGGGCYGVGEKGKTGKMESTRRGELDGAMVWLAKLR